MNKKSINLDYENLYKELARLKSFISTDIREHQEKRHEQKLTDVRAMSGKTNAQIQRNLSLQYEKTCSLVNVLDTILDFMNSSTKEMELLDKELSADIDRKGKKK